MPSLIASYLNNSTPVYVNNYFWLFQCLERTQYIHVLSNHCTLCRCEISATTEAMCFAVVRQVDPWLTTVQQLARIQLLLA